ncbi:MAG: hypothetical protein L3K18_02135 [Thermoplasmata archaeon]|nr:hypothetical protein [Thermoplasmata archaeon]MCI4355929.1 hypothetical protein [Thermoplasmata archaeon]
MAPPVLLREDRRWVVVDVEHRTVGAAELTRTPREAPEPRGIRKLAAVAGIQAGDPVVLEALRSVGFSATLASRAVFARARAALPKRTSAQRRESLLREAEASLAEALSSPEETVIALAREEERVERARSRDDGARASWLGPSEGPLAEYADDWALFRSQLERHHADLVARTERVAHAFAPNLSRVVGPRVAARLIAAGGGLGMIARMPASRLQLLGSRRRPGGGRGPRFGLLYRAEGVDRLPPDRQGAYARTLAALAVIAARADSTTRADLAPVLVRRRDRRLEQLLQRRT